MWWSNAGAQLRSPLALFRGTSQGIGNGFGKGLHSPLLPLALPHAAQQSGQKQPGGIQRLATIGLSPEIGHRPAQVIPQDVQEAHGMPSRDMWGEFPAFCGGEDREEFSSEPGREKRKPPANPPSAPGGALVRSRPPHPRRQLALEGKEKQVTLCICRFPAPLPLPGGSEVADGKCRLHPVLGCSTAAVVALDPCTLGVGACVSGGTPRCGAILAEAHPVPPRAGGLLLVGASHAGAHPFRRVCSLPDAPSGCRTHQRAPPSYPSRVAVSQTSPRRRGDSVASAGRSP